MSTGMQLIRNITLSDSVTYVEGRSQKTGVRREKAGEQGAGGERTGDGMGNG
jgi:hypothetical protein